MDKAEGIGKAYLISFLIVVVDQLVKLVVAGNMQLNQSISIIKPIFSLTYIHNYGAGFGIFQNQRWFFIIFTFVVICVIVYYLTQEPAKFRFGLSFILGGAVSNLIDRIRVGYVIDFFDFKIWPVFNIADSFITIGAIILVVFYMKEK